LTWPDVIEAVKKIPNFFMPNTLESMYNNVMGLLNGTVGSGSSGGSSSGNLGVDYSAQIFAIHEIIDALPVLPNSNESLTWPNLISSVKKIPAVFSQTTLQELYDDVSRLNNNEGGSGSSGVNYEGRIQALEEVADRIPTTFNNLEWISLCRIVGSFPTPGIDLMKTLTWEMVFNAVKKVPTIFQENTLQAMKEAVDAIPPTFNNTEWVQLCEIVGSCLTP
jgi:hypothetical protein